MIVAQLLDRDRGMKEPPFLRRVRLLARRYTLWMRLLWSKGLAPGEQGLVITHAEIDRILEGRQALSEAEAAFYRGNDEARALTTAIADCEPDPKWDTLVRGFRLSGYESDLLMLCAAVELDPWLRRVYGYLHDDATMCHASQWLARALFEWPDEVRLGPDCPMAQWLLVRPGENATSPWTVDPFVIRWLHDPQAADPAMGSTVTIPSADALCLYPNELAAIERAVRSVKCDGVPLEIEIVGGAGSGKRTLAAQLCSRIREDIVAVDANGPSPREHAVRAARLARLRNAVLYWHGGESNFASVPEAAPLTLFGVQATGPAAQAGSIRRGFRLPPLTAEDRRVLWSSLAGGVAPAVIADWDLTAGEVAQAATALSGGPEAVFDTCVRLVRSEPGELFAPLPCPYQWADLVLQDNVRKHLEELENHARLRQAVLDDWGFRSLTPLGQGVSALFAGPSGTGKTMAAQVIARSLGMELYRVDLAGVINKYIGETEKRLKQVFASCERANVMLFFDEADALFGQRMQVKDAHDRFANIEIDYLLQRMEQFNGIAVLATNRKADIDRAFLRRLRFIIDFVPPGPAERYALWRKSLPERTPVGLPLAENIDWHLLAAKLNLTGADIKSAALGAAFLARQEGSTIQMKHVRGAVAREMTKQGQLLRDGELENR